MALTRILTTLHSNLTDVAATQHHVATVAGDLNLADLAENLHASLSSVGTGDHLAIPTQAHMEDEAALSRSLRPDRVRFSPGVAKAWCRITGAGALESPSYNIASITDTAIGDRTVVFDDDFSTDVFSCLAQLAEDTLIARALAYSAFAVGSVRLATSNGTDALQDLPTGCAFYGDQ